MISQHIINHAFIHAWSSPTHVCCLQLRTDCMCGSVPADRFALASVALRLPESISLQILQQRLCHLIHHFTRYLTTLTRCQKLTTEVAFTDTLYPFKIYTTPSPQTWLMSPRSPLSPCRSTPFPSLPSAARRRTRTRTSPRLSPSLTTLRTSTSSTSCSTHGPSGSPSRRAESRTGTSS